MGILPSSPKTQDKATAPAGKRRSMQADFANLKPLKPNGLMGFSKFRDPSEANTNGSSSSKAGKKRANDADSDDDDTEVKNEVFIKLEGDEMQDTNGILSAEDAKRQGELAQGVQKIKVNTSPRLRYSNILMSMQLKRQHSADPVDSPSPAPAHRKSPPSNTPTAGSTPPYIPGDRLSPPLLPGTTYDAGAIKTADSFMVGSPLKKARASLPGVDEESLRAKFGLGLSGVRGDVLGAIEQDKAAGSSNVGPATQDTSGSGNRFGSLSQEKTFFGGQLGETPESDKAVKTEEMEEEL